jgi:hypothetical protein
MPVVQGKKGEPELSTIALNIFITIYYRNANVALINSTIKLHFFPNYLIIIYQLINKNNYTHHFIFMQLCYVFLIIFINIRIIVFLPPLTVLKIF